MIFCNFPKGGPKHEKSPTVELWLAYRLSVFIGFLKKFGFRLLLTISTANLRSDKIRKVR